MMLKSQFSSKVDLTRFGNELFNYSNIQFYFQVFCDNSTAKEGRFLFSCHTCILIDFFWIFSFSLIFKGNPGVADFYEVFCQTLYKASSYTTPAWTVSHAGHSEVPQSLQERLKGQTVLPITISQILTHLTGTVMKYHVSVDRQEGYIFLQCCALRENIIPRETITILAPSTCDISSFPVDICCIRWSKLMIIKLWWCCMATTKFGNKTKSLRTKRNERKLGRFADPQFAF